VAIDAIVDKNLRAMLQGHHIIEFVGRFVQREAALSGLHLSQPQEGE
jgi:hypothetical protein